MKRIIATTAALAALVSAGASHAADRAVAVTGTVSSQCGFDNQSGGGSAGGSAGYTSAVTVPVTGTNGFVDTTSRTLIKFGNVWCNGSNTITLTASPLQHNTAADGTFDNSSFVNHVDMIVSADGLSAKNILSYFGGGQARTGTPLQRTGNGAFETGQDDYTRANISLALPANTAGNDRPLAGGYSGTVTLTVSAT